jgi:hypothetical protein
MNSNNPNEFLKDPSFLMVLLATLAKKNGGSIEFTEEDLLKVDQSDLLGLFHVPEKEGTFAVKVLTPSEYATAQQTARQYAETVPGDDEGWEN